MSTVKVLENDKLKIVSSDDYHHIFRKSDGLSIRYGRTLEDDPLFSPAGAEICDVELSATVSENEADSLIGNEDYIVTEGNCKSVGCASFCYKLNGVGKSMAHMSLKGFKKLADKFPTGLTQIAFGICNINQHPAMYRIFEESNSRGFKSNVTVNGVGITQYHAKRLSELCGAVAVSVNPLNKQSAYNAIQLLSQKYGMSQINIHFVLGNENVADAMGVIQDIKTDPRLSKLNAIVFLSFKDKRKTGLMSSPNVITFKQIVAACEKAEVNFGFDSCSGHLYLQAIKNHPKYKQLSQMVENCCGCRFSSYFNFRGEFFGCSFAEGEAECGWETGIPLSSVANFDELWSSKRVVDFRNKTISLLKEHRNPCHYKIGE
jgi:hypothetical protein